MFHVPCSVSSIIDISTSLQENEGTSADVYRDGTGGLVRHQWQERDKHPDHAEIHRDELLICVPEGIIQQVRCGASHPSNHSMRHSVYSIHPLNHFIRHSVYSIHPLNHFIRHSVYLFTDFYSYTLQSLPTNLPLVLSCLLTKTVWPRKPLKQVLHLAD